MNQVTIDGQKPFKIANKKAIKSKGIRFYKPKEETSESIIEYAESTGHTKFYAMSSGGKDSQTMSNWLAEQDKLEAVCHIQTNIGIQITTDFVKDYCQSRGWKLYVIQPKPKYAYASYVLEYGFPAAGLHGMIMGILKYHTMRNFALTIDRKHHCLATGVRKFESERRFLTYPEPVQSDGNLWSCAPFFYKTNEEIYKEFITKDLPISPAYAAGMNTSGECMCGSFAKKHEKQKLLELDSKLAEYIEWLEDGIQRFGTDDAKKYAKWGMQPKISEQKKQKMLDGFFKDHPDLNDVKDMEQFICGQECGAGTMRGETDF